MSLTINTNIAATRASKYLASNHQNLQTSLDRLSSGKRITQPADDAGGLAVSMKMEFAINGLKGVATGIANGISMLQVQDGVLESVGNVVSRIGELKSMYDDPSKSAADKALYDSEFTSLKAQITAMAANAKFNNVDLFDGAGDKDVNLDATGSTQMTITDTDIDAEAGLTALLGAANFAALTVTQVSTALDEIAGHRATNGGEAKRLQYALADANTQITNLTAANGRIIDVDIAAESANLAKQQVLVQASAAMVAQANVANDVALMLLN